MTEQINIKREGNTVIATYGGDIGIAKCHPNDKFDYITGANIAIKRAMFSHKLRGKDYFIPAPTTEEKFFYYKWDGDALDRWNLEHNLVYLTPSEAIDVAYKMWNVSKEQNII